MDLFKMIEMKKDFFKSEDKIKFIEENDLLNNLRMMGITNEDLKNALSEEEREILLKKFKLDNVKLAVELLSSIGDADKKIDMLQDENITGKWGKYELTTVYKSCNNSYDSQLKLLSNSDFFQSRKIQKNDIVNDFICHMSDSSIKNILGNKKMLERYHIDKNCWDRLSRKLSEKDIIDLLNSPEIKEYRSVNIIKNLSEENKQETILKKHANLKKDEIILLLSEMNVQNLKKFIKGNQEFLEDKDIMIYEITKKLSEEKQVAFISEIDEINLNDSDRRKILITLNENTKEKIDRSNLTGKDIADLDIKYNGKEIVLDLKKELEFYKGLDDLITVRPDEIDENERNKILQLGTICPNISVFDYYGSSTFQEFRNGEKWIDEVIHKIDSNWSDSQKIAYIEQQIGEKISYYPKFETEFEDLNDMRSSYRAIESGYGVCAAIATVCKRMLQRVGIDSEFVEGKNHVFLKLKDIDFARQDGSVQVGDTILDPTWDLNYYKYNLRPYYFCVNYEQLKNLDTINHTNDEALSDVTMGIDVEQYNKGTEIREVFKSLGLANEDGSFLGADWYRKSNQIAKENIPLQEKVKEQLELLESVNPDFEKCMNETMFVLSNYILNHPKDMVFDRCVVKRVYDREDAQKRPKMYIYCDMGEEGKKFFVPQNGKFQEMEMEDFTKKYECYQKDIQNNKGLRGWEDAQKEVLTPEKEVEEVKE